MRPRSPLRYRPLYRRMYCYNFCCVCSATCPGKSHPSWADSEASCHSYRAAYR